MQNPIRGNAVAKWQVLLPLLGRRWDESTTKVTVENDARVQLIVRSLIARSLVRSGVIVSGGCARAS